MKPSPSPFSPNLHGTSFLRILALLAFAIVIAVLSSLITYYFLSKQLQTQHYLNRSKENRANATKESKVAISNNPTNHIPEDFAEFTLGNTGLRIIYPKTQDPIRESNYQDGSDGNYLTKDFQITIWKTHAFVYNVAIGFPLKCNYDRVSNKFTYDPSNQYGSVDKCEFKKETFSGVDFFNTSTGFESRSSYAYMAPVNNRNYMLQISSTYDSECYGNPSMAKILCEQRSQQAKERLEMFMKTFASYNKTLFQ